MKKDSHRYDLNAKNAQVGVRKMNKWDWGHVHVGSRAVLGGL